MATYTANSLPVLALCACCTSHGEARIVWETVTCRECGQACSCDGCVAEHECRENG